MIDTVTKLEYDITYKSIAEETVDVEIKTVRDVQRLQYICRVHCVGAYRETGG